jgi:hypothetical protein
MALDVDFGQLVGAYPRYYLGPTVLDRPPTTAFVVDSDFWGMSKPPAYWLNNYHVIKKLPAIFGLGSPFYWPTNILVYARGPEHHATPSIRIVHPGGA